MKIETSKPSRRPGRFSRLHRSGSRTLLEHRDATLGRGPRNAAVVRASLNVPWGEASPHASTRRVQGACRAPRCSARGSPPARETQTRASWTSPCPASQEFTGRGLGAEGPAPSVSHVTSSHVSLSICSSVFAQPLFPLKTNCVSSNEKRTLCPAAQTSLVPVQQQAQVHSRGTRELTWIQAQKGSWGPPLFIGRLGEEATRVLPPSHPRHQAQWDVRRQVARSTSGRGDGESSPPIFHLNPLFLPGKGGRLSFVLQTHGLHIPS